MKLKYNIAFLAFAIAMAGILTNCSDEDSGGAPRVSYVRITEPASSDSLLVAAAQGQMVAIMGENLQHTVELWFNDQPAALTTTFITANSIITRVPTVLPEEITNQVKLVFNNGASLVYDFSVDVSEPVITRMKSEYASAGEVATFYGDYFYEPVVVTFTGGVVAEVLTVEDQVLEVIVPDGAQPGPITIASNFGVTETNSWFLDNRNIFADFEGPFVNGFWRGGDFVVDSDPDIPNVNNKFMRVNKGEQGAWPYLELYGGPADGDVATLTKVIPEEAFIDPGSYSLKFEINTLETISGAIMRLYLGSADGGGFGDARNNIYYEWQANLDTEGTWETVTIPWADVYTANQQFDYNAAGYGMYIYFHGPNAAIYNFAMDNFRVVPNTND
ncbi:MAG TPA: glycan-binding surface protein [Cyclobacteriaceae bacterium]|nr:glycan-binding surface protein [Cyclobacteriaceae bacterium]